MRRIAKGGSNCSTNARKPPGTLNVQLAPGQAASLDLPGNALVTKRAEVQPIVTAPNRGCAASTEVYLNVLGATTVYVPPDPCSASSTSCAAFEP